MSIVIIVLPFDVCQITPFTTLEKANYNLYINVRGNKSRDARKPAFGVSDQVRQKTVYAVTKDSYKLEILDLGVVLCSEN